MDIPTGAQVADYLRASTDEQVNSTVDQLEVMDRIAEEKKLVVVDKYVEQGESGGSIEERGKLNRLIQDAERGLFQYVRVYDVSRFSRGGATDFWWLVRELKQRGVMLYCCTMKSVVTESEALRFSAEAIQAYQHNKRLSQDVTRTLILNVTKRNCDPGRRAPYGLDRSYFTETGQISARAKALCTT